MKQAKYYELCGHLDKANEIYSMLVVAFTNQNTSSGSLAFTPPLVEKMKVELAIQDWEQADDTANRVNILLMNEISLFLNYRIKKRV